MSTGPLETFVKKVQTAKNYNSKELRVTLLEAEELSIAIALAMTKLVDLSDKIIRLQDELLEARSSNTIDIDMSGGSF